MSEPELRISTSASSASRWLKCTASPWYLAENKARIPDEVREWTTEGLEAHAAAAEVLRGGNATLSPAVQSYVDFVREWADGDAILFVEQEVPLFYRPERIGIVDAAIVTDGLIRIHDYKHGEGVVVEVENNPQLLIYALSFVEAHREDLEMLYDLSDMALEMVVFQPRAMGETVKRWRLPLAEAVELGKAIAEVNDRIVAREGLVFAPSEKTCQFCGARTFCEARISGMLSCFVDETDGGSVGEWVAAGEEADALVLPEPGGMTPRQLALFVRHRGEMRKWLEAVEDWIKGELARGPIEGSGLKLVQGRGGDRQWRDEVAVGKMLARKFGKGVVYTEKLKSPTQIEKGLKGEMSVKMTNMLAELTFRSEGKPTLALADDPRPALGLRTEGFVDEVGEEGKEVAE